ncbi:MAG: pseudouridine synthase [Microbacteriaceae bacterium]
MPPRSPLPQRNGLDAAWVRTPDRDPHHPAPWATMRDWLDNKLGEHIDVAEFIRDERFVGHDGTPLGHDDAYEANTFFWFHRDLRDETEVPGEIGIVHRDERIIVIDKPPFLSTIPRGRHVMQSVVVKLRAELGLPELTPAHRLDRLTSGLLLLTTERRWRAPYQELFQSRTVHKTYLAVADRLPADRLPATVENHLRKQHGSRRVQHLADQPANSRSLVEHSHDTVHEGHERAVYRLTPHTGKTHQLRQHMLTLGIPITGDPLYPEILPVSVDDFTVPLQLLAHSLRFNDPVDGTPRAFEATRAFPIVAPPLGGAHPGH